MRLIDGVTVGLRKKESCIGRWVGVLVGGWVRPAGRRLLGRYELQLLLEIK